MTKELDKIRRDLSKKAEKEAYRVFRLARRAEKKSVSRGLVNEIREEGRNLWTNYRTYPERLLDCNAKYNLKYAFCGERMKHTYITVNTDGDVIKMERR